MNCSLRRCNFERTIQNCSQYCMDEFPNRVRQLKSFAENITNIYQLKLENITGDKIGTSKIVDINDLVVRLECLMPKGAINNEKDIIVLWESNANLDFENNLQKVIELSTRFIYVPFYVSLKLYFNTDSQLEDGDIVKTNLILPANMIPLWKIFNDNGIILNLHALILVNIQEQVIDNPCDLEVPEDNSIQIEIDGNIVCTTIDEFMEYIEYCSRIRNLDTNKIVKSRGENTILEFCFPPELNKNQKFFSLVDLEEVDSRDIYNINRFNRIIFYMKDEKGNIKSGITMPRENALNELKLNNSLYYECKEKNKEGKPILEYRDYGDIDPVYCSIRTHYGNIIIPYSQRHLLGKYNIVEYELVKRPIKSLPLRSRSSALNELDSDVSGLHCGPNSIMDVYDLKALEPKRQRYMYMSNNNYVNKCIIYYKIKKFKLVKHLDDLVFMVPYNLTSAQIKDLSRIFILNKANYTIYYRDGTFYLNPNNLKLIMNDYSISDMNQYTQEEKAITTDILRWEYKFDTEQQFIEHLVRMTRRMIKSKFLNGKSILNLNYIRESLIENYNALIPRKYDTYIKSIIREYYAKFNHLYYERLLGLIIDSLLTYSTDYNVNKRIITNFCKKYVNIDNIPDHNLFIDNVTQFYTNYIKLINDNIDKSSVEIYNLLLSNDPKILGIRIEPFMDSNTNDAIVFKIKMGHNYDALFYQYLTNEIRQKIIDIYSKSSKSTEIKTKLKNLLSDVINIRSLNQNDKNANAAYEFIQYIRELMNELYDIIYTIVSKYYDYSDEESDRKEFEETRIAINNFIEEIPSKYVREYFMDKSQNGFYNIITFMTDIKWREEIITEIKKNQENNSNTDDELFDNVNRELF